MIKIATILGSTRPGRNGEAVAKWVYEVAKKRSDVVVPNGPRHAWRNKGTKPVTMLFSLNGARA